MRQRTIGTAQISGLCIGGNPFSGFSHQGKARNREMLAYYTPDRIKATLATAEINGINTFFGRTDDHIFALLREYWNTGGQIQWFAQICMDRNQPESWKEWLTKAVQLGCTAAYIHGGIADMWYANRNWDSFHHALLRLRDAGIVAGFAAHNPQVHEWLRDHLELDFHICSYYNPTDRSHQAHHISTDEKWDDNDRTRMLEVIATLDAPAIHYKIFGGGNKPILPAFKILGQHMRQNDAALMGFFTKDDASMIATDAALFEAHVDTVLV